MNIAEIIKKRKSTRTYSGEPLTDTHKNILNLYLQELQGLFGEKPSLQIIEKAGTAEKMKLDYGMIRGHHTYLLGIAPATPEARVNYGYVVEKVVLKATELGIATCWIGVFDDEYFKEIAVDEGFAIPSIIILGYPEEKPSGIDKLLRFAVGASRRQEWDKLFFDYHTGKALNPVQMQKYSGALEMLRLAPSSGNTQPWRLFYDEEAKEFHFYKKAINKKYEETGLHDIDMGIAISHFELTCDFDHSSGEWVRFEDGRIKSIEDLQYIISWKE